MTVPVYRDGPASPTSPEVALARRPVAGAGAEEDGAEDVLDKKDPLPIARRFLADRFHHADGRTLQFSGDVFYRWDGTVYVEQENAAMRALLYPWLAKHKCRVKDRKDVVPFKPTKGDVDAVADALKAETYTNARAPAWIPADDSLPHPQRLVVARNGVLDLSATEKGLRQPTPRLFTRNALNYDYDPKAPPPAAWLAFLDELWPDDPESIELLQEWAGYILTLDTRQQKMLLLVGPKRSGKGTIATLLTEMVGAANVCNPTLSSFSTNFGLMPLIGKQLAIIGDARLSPRTDPAIITERLLTLSGEDGITIDRKYMSQVTMRVPPRIMVCTNLLPQLDDSSGALPGRFLILTLKQSFFGREDLRLKDRLLEELTGILNWAIEGWRRLKARGCFVQPSAAQNAVDEMVDLASPIGAFLRDFCDVTSGATVEIPDFWDAWCAWCEQQGHKTHGTQQTLGRDLRAAVPGITTGHPRTADGGRVRTYKGIRLTMVGNAHMAKFRAKRDGAGASREPTWR